jgi:stearoyl-CoA desaturase (delta-9 desaturase)
LARDRAIAAISRRYPIWVALGLALPAVAGGLLAGAWSGVLSGFLWGGLVRMLLVQHVAWIAGAYGAAGRSRNSLMLAVLTLGEGWGENHRAYPTSAAHGLERRQVDVTYWMIRAWELCGLAWDVQRPVSRGARGKAKHRRPLVAG